MLHYLFVYLFQFLFVCFCLSIFILLFVYDSIEYIYRERIHTSKRFILVINFRVQHTQKKNRKIENEI